MARNKFGAGLADWTFGAVGNNLQLLGNIAVSCFSAETGGTQYTDLINAAGSPVSTITSSAGTDGRAIGTIPPFLGPDGVTEMWVSAGGGPRARMTCVPVPSSGGGGGGGDTDGGYPLGTITNGIMTFNRINGKTQTASLASNITTVTIPASSVGFELTLILTQNATGGYTVAWPSNTKLVGGGLPVSAGPGDMTIVRLVFSGFYWVEIGRASFIASVGPTAPYALTTTVGVPAGGALTATTGIPAPDATENLVLTHPITGLSVTRTVSVWRRRRWTTVITPTPPPGATYLFDECEFAVPAQSFCFDVGETNGVANQMQPLIVLRRCSINGNHTSSKGLSGSFVWLIGCDIRGCEDGWAGAAHSVAIGSNFVADTDSLVDPHSDGIQITGGGDLTLWQCWISAGNVEGARNAALRVGTEDGALAGVQVYYCGIDNGGFAMQFRGDAGPGNITGVSVVGCRWTTTAVYGPTDFEETTITTWTDNAYIGGGPIANPVP